jgi:chemotaxis response regulator CheB
MGPRIAIRTLLTDDSLAVRHAVGRLLSGKSQIELVGLASMFQETVRLVGELKPDVIVVDLGMPAAANGEVKTLTVIPDA